MTFSVSALSSGKLLKLITSKAKSLQELRLADLQERRETIEVVSDSLLTIDLRRMEKLGELKLEGSAEPLRIGFGRTKFIKK